MRTSHYEPQPWKMDLDDIGDLSAPKGSVSWARAMRAEMAAMAKESTTELRSFKDYLATMDRERGYQQLDTEFGHPFASLAAFCSHRQPYGLGYDIQVVEAIQQETRNILLGEKVAEVRAMQAVGAPEGNRNARKNNVDIVNIVSGKRLQGGNSTIYLVSRLKRDNPDIAEALEQGKYPSPHAAAKAAGIVKDPSPLTQLRRLWKKATPDERTAFLADILEESPHA